MADISSLGNLQPVEMLDINDTYVPARESVFQLPPKGTYVLQAPDSFPAAAFSATKAGNLSAQIDPTIVGPTREGFTARFIKVSAKPFQRGGVTVSQAGDYLQACGFRGNLRDPQDIADAIESTAGCNYQAVLDWRGYNTKTGFSLEGMERFPKLPDGTHQSWVEDPTPGAVDENGNKYKVRANLIISRFIAAA